MVDFYMTMPFMFRISISKTCNVSKVDEILWCSNSLNGSSVIRCFFCMFLVVVSHHSVELSWLTVESGHYSGRFDLGSLSLVSDKKQTRSLFVFFKSDIQHWQYPIDQDESVECKIQSETWSRHSSKQFLLRRRSNAARNLLHHPQEY